MNPHHVQGDASSHEPALPWWIRWCRWLWKLFAFVGTSVLLALAVNVASTWFTASQETIPADSPFGLLLTHWPIVLPIGCCLFLAALLTWVVSRWRTSASPAPLLSQQNRIRMLDRLRQTYDDLMRQSLQGAMWMDLALSEKPGAVRNAATLLLRTENQPERPLSADTQILNVYNQAAHELLILGAPGAGKSTLLLDLAQQLVKRAIQEADYPLPVILPLSSWAVKRSALQDWIVEQLTQIYDIPRLVSERWVRDEVILPLLDGLDEMEAAARPACIAAINVYHQAHLGIPLVVCSRLADYEAASERQRLVLQSAVVVQPFTSGQADAYLQRIGPPVATLRRAINKNATLQELATTPLMLSVLMLTYQGTTVRALPRKEALLRQQVWTDYVARQVQRKGDVARYPLKQTCHWLSWLAQQMRAHQQPVFYAEYLQADWLRQKQQRTITWLSLRLPAAVLGVSICFLASLFVGSLFNQFIVLFTGAFVLFTGAFLLQMGLFGGFVGVCLGWTIDAGTANSRLQTPVSKRATLMRSFLLGVLIAASFGLFLSPYASLSDWILIGSFFGLGSALSAWVFQIFLFHLPRQRVSVLSKHPSLQGRVSAWFNTIAPRRIWQAAIVLGLGIGLSYGQFYGLSYGLSYGLYGLFYGLFYGLSIGLSIASTVVLLSVLLGASPGTLRFAERIHWTWQSLKRPGHFSINVIIVGVLFLLVGLSDGLSMGLLVGLGSGLLVGLRYGLLIGLGGGLLIGLSFRLSYWLLLGLYQGIIQEHVEDQDRHQFNQGVRRSLRNGALIGLVGAITIAGIGILNTVLSEGLFYGLNYGLSDALDGLRYGMRDGLSDGLSIAWVLAISGFLFMWVMSGGLTILRHYSIRWLLARSRTFPWRAQAFLDDATARILLQRVGGGYRFMHRLLLDYFADLDQTGAPADPAPASVVSTALTPPENPSA